MIVAAITKVTVNIYGNNNGKSIVKEAIVVLVKVIAIVKLTILRIVKVMIKIIAIVEITM